MTGYIFKEFQFYHSSIRPKRGLFFNTVLASFNSIIVRLGQVLENINKGQNKSFNSIIVRLGQEDSFVFGSIKFGFQFYHSSIRPIRQANDIGDCLCFNSIIVRLGRGAKRRGETRILKFQFYHSSIRPQYRFDWT